jgi:hypothetical protein
MIDKTIIISNTQKNRDIDNRPYNYRSLKAITKKICGRNSL